MKMREGAYKWNVADILSKKFNQSAGNWILTKYLMMYGNYY